MAYPPFGFYGRRHMAPTAVFMRLAIQALASPYQSTAGCCSARAWAEMAAKQKAGAALP